MLTLATDAPEALAGHVVRLAATLWRYLDVAAHYHEALILHTTALAAARAGTPEHGVAHQRAGMALIRLGRYDEAAGHFEQALPIALDQRNDLLESMVRNGFATIDDMRGRRAAAREQLRLALAAARRTGHALLEGIALCNIGEHYHWCGDHRTAIDHLERCGAIALDLGSAGLGGPVLAALGSAYAAMDRPEKVDDHFRRAL